MEVDKLRKELSDLKVKHKRSKNRLIESRKLGDKKSLTNSQESIVNFTS